MTARPMRHRALAQRANPGALEDDGAETGASSGAMHAGVAPSAVGAHEAPTSVTQSKPRGRPASGHRAVVGEGVASALRAWRDSDGHTGQDFAEFLPRDPITPSPSEAGTVGAAIVPPVYFDAQHRTWSNLCEAQNRIVRYKACHAFLVTRARLEAFEQSIPPLSELHRALNATTKWGVIRVLGYVQPPQFHAMLARKLFPVMDLVRNEAELFYSPAPDMFHDVMGHLPVLFSAEWAELYHFFGLIGVRARTPAHHASLQALYLRTLEFGLMDPDMNSREGFPLARACGAALLTGLGELELSWQSDMVTRVAFDWHEVVSGPFNTYSPQKRLFVVPSLSWLRDTLAEWARDEGIHP